jgi:hypothetical protein
MNRSSTDEIRQAGADYARRSRSEQGKPPHVTDPTLLSSLARILRADVEDRRAS